MAQPAPDRPPSRPPIEPKSALNRALAAIAANPKRSLREIASAIGVSHQTVARAAQQMKDAGDVTGADVTDPRDPLGYVTEILARSRASPAQKDRIARAMAAHFNRRRRQ